MNLYFIFSIPSSPRIFFEESSNCAEFRSRMTMEIILLLLEILAMIDFGYMGDEKLEKRDKNIHKPSDSPSMQLSYLNRTTLNVYHATDPYSKGHDRRMAEKLHDPNPKNLRQRATYLIDNLCSEWHRRTRLNEKETRDLLNRVFLSINIHESDIEGQMRIKLLEIRPDLRVMDPEIPRSIVHTWYRSMKRAAVSEGRIRLKEDEADLLYTYNRVKYGEGQVYERLAQKWKQFHPHLSNYNDRTLLNMANALSRAQNEFSPVEIERARERYESVFGAESSKRIRKDSISIVSGGERIRTREEEADLLYTYYQVQSGEGSIYDRLANKWKQFRPRLGNYSKATLLKKVHYLSRYHSMFNQEEMTAARMRYESVFGAGSGKDIEAAASRKRKNWTDEQAVDLLYLTILCKGKKLDSKVFQSLWREMHPELALRNTKDICNKRDSLRKWNRKATLTPEEETAARSRLIAALARSEQGHPIQMLDEQGGSSASANAHRQELYQPSFDWTLSPPPLHNSLQLSEEVLNNMEMWMNRNTTDHPPTPRYSPSSFHHGNFSHTVLSPFPGTMSHSRSGLFNYDPRTVNPYYEHGSSSHSHYVPDNINPCYERGNSSHPDDNPHPR